MSIMKHTSPGRNMLPGGLSVERRFSTLACRASQKRIVQRQSLCTILFCSFCALCLPEGKAQGAKTAKNLHGRRRRPCSKETFEKYSQVGVLDREPTCCVYCLYYRVHRSIQIQELFRSSCRVRRLRGDVRVTYHTSLPHHSFRKALPTMSSIFQLLANEEKFTDELFAFITDGDADSRNERAIISFLHETVPQVVSVAECMIMDGVVERHYVADYVHAVVTGEGVDE